MYNCHVSAIQIQGSAHVTVSLSETDENGFTVPLAATSSTESMRFPELAEDSMEEFLEQVVAALVKSLSTVTRRG